MAEVIQNTTTLDIQYQLLIAVFGTLFIIPIVVYIYKSLRDARWESGTV